MDEVLDDAGGADSIEEYMRQNAKNEQLYEEFQARQHREAVNVEDFGLNSLSRGVGAVIPRPFPASSSDTPQSLFPPEFSPMARSAPIVPRLIHRSEKDTFLIYTDGACLNNGQAAARAGWACAFRPQHSGVGGRLENHGPFGDYARQTSNRAELRAVIGALRFRYLVGGGFSTLVIATDSDYVVKGATEWVSSWIRKGWKTAKGTAVQNRDLWEALLGEVER
jgi:ribonuclease HI